VSSASVRGLASCLSASVTFSSMAPQTVRHTTFTISARPVTVELDGVHILVTIALN
jgi:hypothetical protein